VRRPGRRWLGPALIAAAVLIAYGRLVVQPDALIVDLERPMADNATPAVVPRVVGNDLTRLYLPTQRRLASTLRREGRLPTWDPTGFGGRPIPANPQACLWYPPAWVIWALDAPAAWSWITLAHLVWAGWGARRLARVAGAGQAGAGLAGVAFALSPYMTAQVQAGHVPHVWAASWMGWALAALMLGLRGRASAWWALAATLALAALAGHPQEAYLLALAVVGWGCVAAARGPRRLVGLGGSMVGAMMLSAVGWLPVLMMLGESRTAGGVPGAAGEPYAIGASNLIQLAWPLARGGPADFLGRGNYAETQLGPGLIVVGLAVVAVVARWRRGWPWVVLVGVCWLVAAGRPLGVYESLRASVPGFDQMRVPARTLFLAGLGWAVLAGLGVDGLRWGVRRPFRAGRLLAVLAALELIVLAWAVVRVTPPERLPGPDALDAALLRHRRDPLHRIRAPEHLVDAARMDRLGLEMTDRYDWFQLRRSADLYESLYAYGAPPRVWTRFDPWGEAFRERFRRTVLDRMGVALLVSGPGLVAPPGPQAERIGSVDLHPHPAPLPRAYVVPEVWFAPEAGWRLALAWLDPRRYVLMDADPLPAGPRQAYTPAEYQAVACDRIEIGVRTESPGLLVVTDAWAPGWRAWRDGVEVPVLRGDHAHRVIALPRGGDHHVEMRYEPPGLGAGMVISGVGWAAWAAAGWRARRRSGGL
jgi:hypothetical protein